jgi:hypothetical protein
VDGQRRRNGLGFKDRTVTRFMALFMFWGGEKLEAIFGKKDLNKEPKLRIVGAGVLVALAVVVLLTCALFTAFTGASGVTIVALGGLLYPSLLKEQYPERFALGLVTTSGSLGLLFPPSLPIIIYAIVSKVQINDLFLAGLLPGILMVILSLCSVSRRPSPRTARTTSAAPSPSKSARASRSGLRTSSASSGCS